jgi:hypothetical protein
MAAAAAAMHAVFTRIGFADNVASSIVDVQGYATPDYTCHLSNREVSNLCKSVATPVVSKQVVRPHSGSWSIPELKPISCFVSFG